MLSANAHTAESFGSAIIGASLAAAAEKAGTAETTRADQDGAECHVTQITGIGAWVRVGISGFGTFCKLERQD
jgi:hypothetical protein